MKLRISRYQKLIITSSLYLVLSILIFLISVFAWFSIDNTNNASLTQSIREFDFSYEFYSYISPTNDGSKGLELIEDNLFDGTKGYKLINTEDVAITNGLVIPTDRFSYAIKVANNSNKTRLITLELFNVISSGYDKDVNKIQTAFTYQITKVVVGGTDTEETYLPKHFVYNINSYVVNNEIELLGNSVTIIYFDFYFDPNIKGFDNDNNPYLNSNIFINQELEIESISVKVSD